MSYLPFVVPEISGLRTVWVSRHGRTTGNELNLLQGWSNHGLSVSGRAEAAEARQWWDERRIHRVVASPVLRACQTAEALFDRVDDIDSGWVELATPAHAGLTGAEAHRQQPLLFRENGWPRRDAPRSSMQEHLDTVASRAVGALLRAAESVKEEENVAVVTHGSVLLALLGLSGSPVTMVNNLTVLEIEVRPVRGWRLLKAHQPFPPAPER